MRGRLRSKAHQAGMHDDCIDDAAEAVEGQRWRDKPSRDERKQAGNPAATDPRDPLGKHDAPAPNQALEQEHRWADQKGYEQ
jgi:hypothetical protein